MNRKFSPALLLALALMLSCTREPIYEGVSQYRFEFSFPDSVQWCRPERPELIQILFYDPVTGKRVSETYMSPDGGYLYAIEPGRWNIVAFTMGSTRTMVDYARDFSLLSAHTSLIQSAPMRIADSPDHIFVATLQDVDIPQLSEADEPFVLDIPLKPLCDSWRVEVSGIEGLEYASSITLLAFNQAGEVRLCDMDRGDWCTIKASGTVQDSLAVIPFCTFGMPPDGNIVIRVIIEAEDGQKHSNDFDITAQVRSPLKRDHIISVDFRTELMPLVQGGLDPRSDEWEDHNEFLEIE